MAVPFHLLHPELRCLYHDVAMSLLSLPTVAPLGGGTTATD